MYQVCHVSSVVELKWNDPIAKLIVSTLFCAGYAYIDLQIPIAKLIVL